MASIQVYYADGVDEYESDKEYFYAYSVVDRALYIYKRHQRGGEIAATSVYPHKAWTRLISDAD